MTLFPSLRVCLPLVLLLSGVALAESNWTRFRGPNGTGVDPGKQGAPASWDDSKNLKWKAELPGPGSSCPIVVGDKVFVTCWTGYADGSDGGSLEDLKRHLVCLDRASGKILWKSSVDAKLPEDSFRGMFAENGYATHTPCSDGEIVVAFFGKSGVHAYDLTGKPLWQADVGSDLDDRGWGSASSPIIYKDKVIVTASIENRALVALDKKTGKVAWKQEADGFAATWGTPVIAKSDNGAELVLAVPYEIWSLNPENGKLRWYCEAIGSNSMCSSVTVTDGVVYAMESGPGGGGAVAIRTGGKDDVAKSHLVWEEQHRSRVGTPVVHNDRIYWVNSGVANCVDAKTGKRIYQERLTPPRGSARTTEPPTERGRERDAGDRPDRGGRGGFGGFGGGRGGGRGGRGGQDYSSPIISGDHLYYAKRNGEVYVIKLGDKFEQVAVNRFSESAGDYHATPAAVDGQLFLRASRVLYCVEQ